MSELKAYTAEEVAKHNKDTDCWIIVGNDENGGPKVYDVTKYLDKHPAGDKAIMEYAGENADMAFTANGHSAFAQGLLKTFIIGTLKEDPEVVNARKAVHKKLGKTKGGLNPLAVLFLLFVIGLGIYLAQQRKTVQ
eukprot:gene9798-10836_t